MKIFKRAILIVHGFAGGVYDYENLSHELECVSNFDVFTFTLPGHDDNKNIKLTYDLWIKKSEEEVEYLIKKGYKKIYLIGYSMGGVIASHLVYKYRQIKKLILAAPAFRYIGYENGKLNYESIITKPQKIIKQYGGRMVLSRMFKLPFNAVFEFRKLVENYSESIKHDKIDTLIIWGTNDNIVPKEAIEYAYNNIKHKRKKIIYIEGYTHNLFNEDIDNVLTKQIIKFLNHKFTYNYDTLNIEK